eukprot:jgi/Ulvmu1/3092/UM015_0132.1
MSQFSIFQQQTKRESGKKAQHGNISAAKAVADIIRSTLGPRSMLKMLLDPNGGIVLTNDGNAILREIDVSHPAAKSIIELSRTQDEEVGDGTTSVIILAGEMLTAAEPHLARNIHPTVICRAFMRALDDAVETVEKLAFTIDFDDRAALLKVVDSCIATKFTRRFGTLIPELAVDSVRCVMRIMDNEKREVEVKKYAKIEKIPGGAIEDCQVLDGVLFSKDVVNPSRMKRIVRNPRILLLDCPVEYKKGENQTNVELLQETDFAELLKQEEEEIKHMVDHILQFKPTVVITEKGLSDFAAHHLQKAGVTAIRRLRKTDNNRVARACGATIVNRPEDIKETDIGTGAGLFEVKKIGDEYYTSIVECKDPKACTVLLRGASKDVLNEVERNLQDAMGVARNIAIDARLVPGGGAIEMAVSHALQQRAAAMETVEALPYKSAATALEVIPRTLVGNCGANIIRTMTKLRAAHADTPGCSIGINGETGQITDMKELGIWEPAAVKLQTLKTSVEAAVLLLRIDDIVSGMKKSSRAAAKPAPAGTQVEGDGDNVDSERMLAE